MELCADVPTLVGYLDNLDEVGGRVDAYALHAGLLVFLLILIVELIAMAMAFLDKETLPRPLSVSEGGRLLRLQVCFIRFAAFH